MSTPTKYTTDISAQVKREMLESDPLHLLIPLKKGTYDNRNDERPEIPNVVELINQYNKNTTNIATTAVGIVLESAEKVETIIREFGTPDIVNGEVYERQLREMVREWFLKPGPGQLAQLVSKLALWTEDLMNEHPGKTSIIVSIAPAVMAYATSYYWSGLLFASSPMVEEFSVWQGGKSPKKRSPKRRLPKEERGCKLSPKTKSQKKRSCRSNLTSRSVVAGCTKNPNTNSRKPCVMNRSPRSPSRRSPPKTVAGGRLSPFRFF